MTLETLLITGISAVAGALVAVWGSYIIMTSKKDADIQKERDRSDRLLLEQQVRHDVGAAIERAEHKETLEFHINHYEQLISVLKDRYHLDPNALEEETAKIQKSSLSESQISKITSAMKLKFENFKERGNGDNGTNHTTN